MSIGFLQATLEPHLRQFNLSHVVLGLMFVINGGTYALTAPIWGWFCDKYSHPKVKLFKIRLTIDLIKRENLIDFCFFLLQVVTAIGCILVAIAFSLVGPAPFIPYPTLIWMTVCGLVVHGLGMSAQLVASFTDALRTCM